MNRNQSAQECLSINYGLFQTPDNWEPESEENFCPAKIKDCARKSQGCAKGECPLKFILPEKEGKRKKPAFSFHSCQTMISVIDSPIFVASVELTNGKGRISDAGTGKTVEDALFQAITRTIKKDGFLIGCNSGGNRIGHLASAVVKIGEETFPGKGKGKTNIEALTRAFLDSFNKFLSSSSN